jgi:hypothetical protein
VETFLVSRHQAKIEALTASENQWKRRWQVTQEIAFHAAALVGYAVTVTAFGVWLLAGGFPG